MSKILRAVALEYGLRKTPVVSTKGSGELAEQVIEEAHRQGIYVTHDPKLAGLLGDLKIDQEIPKHLYTAVAVILSWAYWLKGLRPGDEKTVADKNQASA